MPAPAPAGKRAGIPDCDGDGTISRRDFLRGALGAPLLLACPTLAYRAGAQEAPRGDVLAVFGDSQGQGLASALRHQLRQEPGLRVLNRTKAGTSISQATPHDWVAAVAQSVAEDRLTLAVMFFGGNDRVPVRLPDGRNLPFRSDGYRALYRDRVEAMLKALLDAGVKVFWVGAPNARHAGYARDMEWLNAIYREVIGERPVVWVDTAALTVNAAGEFESYGRGLDGRTARLRGDDGIHFTAAGYEVVASRVVDAVRAHRAGA